MENNDDEQDNACVTLTRLGELLTFNPDGVLDKQASGRLNSGPVVAFLLNRKFNLLVFP